MYNIIIAPAVLILRLMCVHAHLFVCVSKYPSSADSNGLFLALFALEPVFG